MKRPITKVLLPQQKGMPFVAMMRQLNILQNSIHQLEGALNTLTLANAGVDTENEAASNFRILIDDNLDVHVYDGTVYELVLNDQGKPTGQLKKRENLLQDLQSSQEPVHS